MAMIEFDVFNKRDCDYLYSQIQRIYFKISNKEEKLLQVRIVLDMISGVGPLNEKGLLLKLTDDSDPYFFYYMIIAESDYKTLKLEQGLLVDFDSFPSQLTILLKQCMQDEVSGGTTRCILQSGEDDVHHFSRFMWLKVVENTQFKQICHISLKLGGSSDEEIKQHMAQKIKNLQEALIKSEREMEIVKDKLKQSNQAFDSLSHDMGKYKEKWTEEKNAIQVQCLQELASEREKFKNAQIIWQNQLDTQKKMSDEHHRAVLKDLESQIADLKLENQESSQKNVQLKNKNRELKTELEEAQQALKLSHASIVTLQRQNAQLDGEYHNKKKDAVQYKKQLESTVEDLKRKIEDNEKLQSDLTHAIQLKNAVQKESAMKDENLKKRLSDVETLSVELYKTNQIVKTLEDKNDDLVSKLHLRTKVTFQQEKLLGKKDKELIRVQSELFESNANIKSLEEEISDLKEKLEAASKKNEENEKTLKQNSTVITWLNRQLTETQTRSQSSLPTSSLFPGTHERPPQTSQLKLPHHFQAVASTSFAPFVPAVSSETCPSHSARSSTSTNTTFQRKPIILGRQTHQGDQQHSKSELKTGNQEGKVTKTLQNPREVRTKILQPSDYYAEERKSTNKGEDHKGTRRQTAAKSRVSTFSSAYFPPS